VVDEVGTVGEYGTGRMSGIKPEIVIRRPRGGGGVVGQDEGGVLSVDIWGFNSWFPCWSLYLRVRLCLQLRRVNRSNRNRNEIRTLIHKNKN
jgi:hypothetical protein